SGVPGALAVVTRRTIS
ncbi:TPA: chloramphenicol resistance leader peptide, partial [Pseudomonas aeruginosa]